MNNNWWCAVKALVTRIARGLVATWPFLKPWFARLLKLLRWILK